MTNQQTIVVVTFHFFFFIQLLSTIAVTSSTPVDNFAVNCGSSGNSSSLGGREWTGDIDSERFSLIELSNSKKSSVRASVVGKTNPYNTARLYRSEFTYSFTVSDGQNFIRLHFYPSSYNPDFPRSEAMFSVKAGPHTLLQDFNASLNVDAGVSYNFAAPEGAIVLEYCVNVDPGERLNITFTPSPSYPDAYAFVNGIEVISMPTYLYYTNPNNLQGMMLDGGTQQFPVKSSSALQTMYRTDVGGRQISPEQDAGMLFRYWDSDNAYLKSGERPRSISAVFGLNLTYRNDQNYFAPDVIYKTARIYGMNEKSKFNVTWEFEVDSLFYYMVRLHFCEFDEHIEKAGDRIFQIFINDALVEPVADVMLWTQGQRLVFVHRDYAVSMLSDGSLKKHNLSIKLQPHPTARSTYRDVLLNGMEILKISDRNGNLAGINPDPLQSPPLPTTPSSN